MRLLEKLLEVVAMTAFVGTLLATISQVMFRYVLEIPVPWTEELARALFTTSMFLGMAIALRENEHIVVDFLFKRMSPRAQALGNVTIYLTALMFLVMLAFGAVKMVRITYESYLIALGWVRTGYLYLFELIAICIMILYASAKIIASFKALIRRAPARREGEAK
jgi:TRAP-type C4-dicarboxylate transport system permease small subunit